MNSTAENFEIDRQKVQEILARFTLPNEIENVDTEFDLDSSGDPAVRLTFHVRNEAHIGQEDIERLTRFLSEVTVALLQGNISGFPYTRLEQKA